MVVAAVAAAAAAGTDRAGVRAVQQLLQLLAEAVPLSLGGEGAVDDLNLLRAVLAPLRAEAGPPPRARIRISRGAGSGGRAGDGAAPARRARP